MGRRQLDLVGQRFGWLTVKEKVPKRIEDVRTTFVCECSGGGTGSGVWAVTAITY